MVEFNKDNTYVEDLELWEDNTGFDCYLSTWFDTFKKFGINADKDEDLSVDCYLVGHLDDLDKRGLSLQVDYIIKNFCDGYETYETYQLNDREKNVLLELVDDYTQHEFGKTVKELLVGKEQENG